MKLRRLPESIKLTILITEKLSRPAVPDHDSAVGNETSRSAVRSGRRRSPPFLRAAPAWQRPVVLQPPVPPRPARPDTGRDSTVAATSKSPGRRSHAAGTEAATGPLAAGKRIVARVVRPIHATRGRAKRCGTGA